MGTRRGLLRLGVALPLAGLLAGLLGEESVAERPHERLGRRTQQRNRKQRNTQNNGSGSNTGGGGGGGGGGGNGGGGGGNGGGGNDNNNNNGNTLGSGAPCGSGPACSSGAVCLSGDCFTTCPGPFSCLAGSGGCPQSFAACQQTTSGTSVCITLTTNDTLYHRRRLRPWGGLHQESPRPLLPGQPPRLLRGECVNPPAPSGEDTLPAYGVV